MNNAPDDVHKSLSAGGCALVLVTAFLGWFFAGTQLAVSSLVMRDAAKNMLGSVDEAAIGQLFGWLICAFLFGAAAGGFIFGRFGDRFGRAKAMAASILCYSIFSGASYFVVEPWHLLVLRFLTCLGIGGMWPNGIALVSEAWPNISRPLLAGVIGTAANVGIMSMAAIACFVYITPDSWRWVMVLGAYPAVLGLLVLAVVPESPRWLAVRKSEKETNKERPPFGEIFRPPLLKTTILGIALGTIPLFGGWGSTNWANAWASQVGDTTTQASSEAVEKKPAKPDPALKAKILLARSAPGSLSSLLGGGLAVLLGRRRCYFLLSLAALGCSQYLFWFLTPTDPQFIIWTAALGLFSGFFFGWLPLCLPEMFPTRLRSTGAGVSFNFGRIITAFGILVAAGMMKEFFQGDYAQIGRVTSLIYAVGMVVILFAPDQSKQGLED